jgi:hypothetical protein
MIRRVKPRRIVIGFAVLFALLGSAGRCPRHVVVEEPGEVTLAMGSDHARLAAGDSAALDGLAVLVIAVGGQDVQLVVRSL